MDIFLGIKAESETLTVFWNRFVYIAAISHIDSNASQKATDLDPRLI